MDQLQCREERYQARRDELRTTERLPEAFLPEGQWGAWLHGMRQAATAERTGTYGDNVSLQAGRPNIHCALASGVVGPTGHRRLRGAASRGPRGQVAAAPPAAVPAGAGPYALAQRATDDARQLWGRQSTPCAWPTTAAALGK